MPPRAILATLTIPCSGSSSFPPLLPQMENTDTTESTGEETPTTEVEPWDSYDYSYSPDPPTPPSPYYDIFDYDYIREQTSGGFPKQQEQLALTTMATLLGMVDTTRLLAIRDMHFSASEGEKVTSVDYVVRISPHTQFVEYLRFLTLKILTKDTWRVVNAIVAPK
ncbi:hypothetical protein BDZ91DRAFT_92297 [Kalaharituber pfeilii]|nr:hypothetical protein BDZ91DRAFT_92297 [Kalaharituber pfeilii]